MKSFFKEFRQFLERGNFVDFAVAVVIGAAIKGVIDAIVKGIINPVIAAILQQPSLADVGFDLGESFVSIGLVIDSLITFVSVAFVLFLIVKAYNRVTKRDTSAMATEIDLLTEIRDELRSQRPQQPPAA